MKTSPKLIDYTGRKFGRLTAVSYAGKGRWQCLCECGKTSFPLASNLRAGQTTSCGCLRTEMKQVIARKHGYYHTKAYKSWYSIKRRCTEPNDSSYALYGGKGITLYAPWVNDPQAFCEYIGPAPSPKHSVDRIDNSKGYEPGNIRWATDIEQANNKTNNVHIEFQGHQFTSINAFVRWIVSQTNVNRVSVHRELARQLEGK